MALRCHGRNPFVSQVSSHCGFTYGSHHAGTVASRNPFVSQVSSHPSERPCMGSSVGRRNPFVSQVSSHLI